MNLTLVIDTETTGLPPRNKSPSLYEAFDGCRMVQIAWELYTSDGKRISTECFLIGLDATTVMSEGAARVHGITKEHAILHGVPRSVIWERLETLLPKVSTIVAHNMAFDDSVIQSEMYRDNRYEVINEWNKKRKVCTMRNGTAPGKKWPKLAELYLECFGRSPLGALHQADTDVRVCAEIYFHQKSKT